MQSRSCNGDVGAGAAGGERMALGAVVDAKRMIRPEWLAQLGVDCAVLEAVAAHPRAAIHALIESRDACARVGVPTAVVQIGGMQLVEEAMDSYGAILDWMGEMAIGTFCYPVCLGPEQTRLVERLVTVASRAGVRLAAHPVEGPPDSADPALPSLAELGRFLAAVRSPYHGLAFCAPLFGTAAAEGGAVIEQFADKIFYVQGCTGLESDLRVRSACLEFIAALNAGGFGGVVCCGPAACTGAAAAEPVISRSLDFLHAAGFMRGVLEARGGDRVRPSRAAIS